MTFDGLRNGTRKKILSRVGPRGSKRKRYDPSWRVFARVKYLRVESSSNTSCPVIFHVVHGRACLCAAKALALRRVWARAKTLRSRSPVHTRALPMHTRGHIACRRPTFATPKFLCAAHSTSRIFFLLKKLTAEC